MTIERFWKTRFVVPVVAALAIFAAVGGGIVMAQVQNADDEWKVQPTDDEWQAQLANDERQTQLAVEERLANLTDEEKAGWPSEPRDSGIVIVHQYDFHHHAFVGLEKPSSPFPSSGDELADALEPVLDGSGSIWGQGDTHGLAANWLLNAVAEESATPWTQDDVDELASWLENAPAAVFELSSRIEDSNEGRRLAGGFTAKLNGADIDNINVGIAESLGVSVDDVRRAFVVSLGLKDFDFALDDQIIPASPAAFFEELGVAPEQYREVHIGVGNRHHDTVLMTLLDGAVEAELLTSSEAGDIQSWVDDAPGVADGLLIKSLEHLDFGGGFFGRFNKYESVGSDRFHYFPETGEIRSYDK